MPDETRPSSEAGGGQRWFDRFATVVDHWVSSAYWFAFSVLLVLLWAIWGPFAGFSSVWQLVINTGTTILTFLLVGLAANAAARSGKAVHLKLNAIAAALEDLMEEKDGEDRRRDAEELRAAVGLENETGS
jgi:low affinity Fe/Cu permease